MSDLKIQGVVEMSSEGAERAFDRIGQKSDQMAAKVSQSSGQAGQAVDQIGAGADRSANEFTRAEGRIVSSIRRATTEINNLGKTASQRIELRIDTSGLDKAKFEPLLANLRELEAAQNRVTTSGRGYAGQLQNTSYQLQDFIVQVNGGTDATRALAMQLPQMLIGFGAAGAAIGVVAALLPNLIALFSDSADGAKSLDDAMSGLSDAVGAVGQTVKSFDMTGLYEQFNAANAATRAATIEQIKFQQAFIETQRLVSQKAFGASIQGIGEFGFLDKLTGGGTAGSRVADDLGVTLEVAEQLAPVLNGLRDGTEDVGSAFTRFGTQLLSGNKEAVALATAMRDLANGEKDAYAASSALSEALERMAKGYVTIDKAGAGAGRSSRAAADGAERLAEASRELVQSLLGQSSGLSADFFKKWNLLGAAYKAGAISLQDLTDAQGALLAQQPAMKQAAKDAEDYGKALASTVGALEARALALEAELSTYGLTKTEIERTTIARMEEVRAMAAANGATKDYLDTLDREIAARRRIAQATAGIEAEEANRKAAEQAAADWQRTAQEIEGAIYDAIVSGGEDAGEVLERTFKALVLRPIIQPIAQAAAGVVTGALWFGAPGQGGGGYSGYAPAKSGGSSGGFGTPGVPGMDMMGIAANGLSWLGGATGLTGLTSFAAGMGMTSYTSAAAMTGLAEAGLVSGVTSGAAASAGSVLGAIGAAAPYIAVALFAAQALGLFDKKPSDKTSAVTVDTSDLSVDDVWDMGGKKAASQEQKDANTALSMLVGGFAQQVGLDGQIVTAMGARDGTRLAIEGGFDTPMGEVAGGKWLGGKETAYNYGNGSEAIQKMLDDLIDEGTLPQETIDRWRALKTNVDGSARDAVELVDTMALINQGLTDTEILRADLIQAEGETLGQAATRIRDLQSMFDPLTADEAWTKATTDLADAFTEAGVAMPATKSAFLDVMDSLDLTTEAGQEAYRAMTSLAPAFYDLATAVEEVMRSVSSVTADSIESIQLSVLDDMGKYEFYDQRLDQLDADLAAATNPAEIDRIVRESNETALAAWNLLDKDEQKRLAPDFISRLEGTEDLAGTRLSVIPLDYGAAAPQAQQDLVKAQTEAAAQQGEAAKALTDAALAFEKFLARVTTKTEDGAVALIAAGRDLSEAAFAISVSQAQQYQTEVGY